MKKCLVLDLDNTLWGGVVGEDGKEKLALSLTAPGNSFIAFQQAILDCYNRGILLAINSRNNEADALDVIRTHPNMILKDNHFAAKRINWDDKVRNMRSLSEELNIGLDSFVFLDDDPTNRAWVRNELPEVTVPELPGNPAEYTAFFLALPYFEGGDVTDEDKMRGNMYVTERLRREAEKQFADRLAFLGNLDLKLYVYVNNESCLSRLAQLTEKTNQFNTKKNPLSPDVIRSLMRDGYHRVYHAKLVDRFGDHGVIFFMIVKTDEAPWRVTSALMSCRVFDRGVENAILSKLLFDARADGVRDVSIEFEQSAKNAPAEAFVKRYFSSGTCSTDAAVEKYPMTILYG